MTITRRRFDEAVRRYRPLAIEEFSAGDRRLTTPIHHLQKNRDRFWLAVGAAAPFLPPGRVAVADLGVYPGTLLRLVHRLLPAGSRLVGAGLMTSEDFRRQMAADCGAEILTVNLDPRNEQLRGKGPRASRSSTGPSTSPSRSRSSSTWCRRPISSPRPSAFSRPAATSRSRRRT
jgi:hypothetical protein